VKLPRVYWYVWWGTLINRLGGFVVPLMTMYLTQVRGTSVKTAGAIVSGFGAGQILASIVGGQMTDRLGRKITMLVSLSGGAVVMAVLGLQDDIATIAILVIVLGFVGELYRPAVAALVSDVVGEEQRTRAYGLLYWAVNLGFGFAAAVGGLLAKVDFQLLFFVDAITMGAYAVLVLVKVPETRPVKVARAKPSAPAVAWWRDRPFVTFVGLNFLLSLLPMQTGAVLSAHMAAQGFSTVAYGIVLGANGVLIIIAQPFVLKWIEHRDNGGSGGNPRDRNEKILVAAAVLYGFGMIAHGAAPIVALHVGAVMIWTCAELLESPVRSTMVAQMAPASARGRYQGAFVMTWGAATLVAPRLGTQIWEDCSPWALWLGCAGLAAFIALALAATASGRRSRLAEIASAPPAPPG